MVLNEITEMETECKYMAFVGSFDIEKGLLSLSIGRQGRGKEDGRTKVGRNGTERKEIEGRKEK